MAQVNWNSFERDSVNQSCQQPMRMSRLTEGERLHEQALAFYAHGNLAQADLFLNKAIALEPMNNSFRETRHFFSELASSRSQRQRAADVGYPYMEDESTRRQFNRNAAPLPRQTSDSRRPTQHCPNFLSPNPRGLCPQPVNGNQYFSNTVADSMFGPTYWVPAVSVPNLSRQEGSHVENPRPVQRPNNSYSVGRNFGPQHRTACNTTNSASKPDHLWGEWSDEVKPSSCEETWWDSSYQQSDIPWTQEPRKDVSQSNGSRSSANCSASQGSYRGSMANSARDLYNKVGRCSEETNSLDSFEESTNKVQEWLVKNEKTGVLPPPGFEKLKKNKKKKKKKMQVSRKETEPQKMDASHLDKRDLGRKPSDRCKNPASTGGDVQDSTSCQQDEIKTSQMNSASNHNTTSPRRTVPLTKKPLNNSNPVLSQMYENSTRSESSSANTKPFFDPKRIFTPSHGSNGCASTRTTDQRDWSGPQGKTASKRTDVNKRDKNAPKTVPPSNKNTISGQPGNAQITHRQQNDQKVPRNSSASSPSHTSQHRTEIGSPVKGMNEGRPDGFNCPESDTSARVMKDKQNGSVSRMGVPPGYLSPECAKTDQCSLPATNAHQPNTGFLGKTEDTTQSSTAAPFRYNPESQLPIHGFRTINLEENSAAGSTYTSAEEHSPVRQAKFIDVKSMAGNMEKCTPVCQAATNTLASRGPVRTPHLPRRAASQTTETTQKTRPSCPIPLAKEINPSEAGSNLGGTKSHPSDKPKDKVPPAKEPNAQCKDRNNCEETRSRTDSKEEVAAKVSSAQTTKAFWEPTRIFAVPKKDRKSKKVQVKASGTGVEQTKKPDCNISPPPNHQTTGLKKDPTKNTCEDPQQVSNPSTKSNQEVKKPCTQTDCTQTTSTPLTKSPSPDRVASTSNCSNDVGVSHSKAVPSDSASGYSYVAWRNLSTQNDNDSAKKTDPSYSSTSSPEDTSLPNSNPKSNTTGATRKSGQVPAENATKFNKSQSSEKDSIDQFDLGMKQNRSKFETVPDKMKTQQREFSHTGDLPSNPTPEQKPIPGMTSSSRTCSAESKSKPSSASPQKGQTFKSEPEGTNSTKASHSARPSAQSKSSCQQQTGASQGTRTKPASSGASAGTQSSSEGRKSVPRERNRRQEATSDGRESQDELEIEDVDPWYKWTRAIGQGLWWAVCFVVFLMLILLACLYSTLKFGAKYCWHIVRELWKVCQESWREEGQGSSSSQGHRSQSSSSSSQGFGAGSNQRSTMYPTESIDIPTSGDAAIKRLLRCNADNPYEVLGVSSEASDEDIKKYYRKQCMLVHPDKNDLPNAQEAFQILQKAYDTLTDPVKKREFEMESRHAPFSEEMEDFVKKMEEVLNSLSCDVCHKKHRRYETDRDPFSARYCRRHDMRHPAYEGDVWVETTHLGFKWHYFAMMEDRIFDITEWAACQDMKYMEPNACEVRYHVGTRGSRNSSRQRHQSPNSHGYSNSNPYGQRGQEYNANMTEELLKEFLRQFQQGDARGGMPRGNFGGGGVPRGGGGDASNAGQDRSKRHKKHRKKKR